MLPAKIREYDANELETKLLMSFGAISLTYGIADAEEFVYEKIIDYVNRNYSFLDIGDIEKAFEMASLGQLFSDSGDEISLELYGKSMNVAFVGKILKSYKLWRRKQKQSAPTALLPAPPKVSDEDLKQMLDDDLIEFKRQIVAKEDTNVGCHHYRHIEKYYYKFTDQEKINSMKEVRVLVESKVKSEVNKSFRSLMKDTIHTLQKTYAQKYLAVKWINENKI